jgi:hypothetical protein
MINKSFLIGLGIGLLLATITLQLDFMKSGETSTTSAPLTIEQLREQAEQSGYQLKTEKEVQLEIEKAIEQYKNQQKSSSKTSDAKTTNKNSTSKQQPANNDTTKKVTIKKGWDATQVANYLYKEGIIKDKKALVNALVGIYKTRQIAARTFQLAPNSDPKVVANVITGGNP